MSKLAFYFESKENGKYYHVTIYNAGEVMVIYTFQEFRGALELMQSLIACNIQSLSEHPYDQNI